MAISTNGTVLTRLAGALYNTQMSNATYKEVAALDPSSLANTLYARDFGSTTDLAVATTLVKNLGLTSVTGLANWVAAQLTAAGSAKGAKVVDLLNGFAQLSADATYGAAATAFNTKVNSALALSQTTDNEGGTFDAISTSVSGKEFTLTASRDNLTGTAGNDLFDGVSESLTSNALSSTDSINGGAGTDELVFLGSIASASLAPTLTSIETITAQADATTTLNLINATGYTTLNADAGSESLTFANVASVVAYGMSNLIGSGKGVTINHTNTALAGAADNATVTLDNASYDVAAGSAYDLTFTKTTGTNKLETVTLVTTGGASKIDDLVVTDQGVTTLVVKGDQDLTIDTLTDSTATGVTLRTIDASALTGGLTVTGTSTSTTGNTITGGSGKDSLTGGSANDVISGGEGNDTIVGAAGEDNLSGGNGNDTVKVTGSDVTNKDTISGGDGTDTIAIIGGGVAASSATGVSGFETLALGSDDSQAVNAFSGIATLSVAHSTVDGSATDANNKTTAFTAAAGTEALSITSLGSTDDVTVSLNTDGTADSISVTIGSAAAGTGESFDVLTLDNYETITIATAGASGTVTDFAASSLKSLTINAAKALTLDSNSTSTWSSLATIDASGSTADVNFAGTSGGLDRAATVTGGSGNDTFTGSGSADNISGGAGNDVLAGNAGNDTLAGGDGNDSLTGGSGNDVFTGGAGNDTVIGAAGNDNIDLGENTDVAVFAAASTSNVASITYLDRYDTVNGGDGTDTLRLDLTGLTEDTAFGYTASNAASLTTFNGVSNMETIQLIGDLAANKTVTLNLGDVLLSKFNNNLTISTGATSGTTTLTDDIALAVNSSSITNSAATVTVSFAGADESDEVLTYTVGPNIDKVTGTIGNDSFNVTASSNLGGTDALAGGAGDDTLVFNTDAALTVVGSTLELVTGVETISVNNGTTKTGATSITLSNAATVANAKASTNVLTVSRDTDETGTLTVDGSAVTGSGLALTGALGADSLTGGAGNDVLTGSSGVDSLVGGAGNDTFVYAASSDISTGEVISGGDGTDTIQLTSGVSSATVDFRYATLSGIEAIDALGGSASGSAVFKSTQLSSTTLITESTASTDMVIKVVAAGTEVDVSGFTFGTNRTTGVTLANDASYVSLPVSLTGTSKADSITGGNNDDSIVGGLGADTISGGYGADLVTITEAATSRSVDVLKYAQYGTANVDTVVGATAGSDVISISIDSLLNAVGGTSYTLSTAGGTDISAVIAAGDFTTQSVAAAATTTNTSGTNAIFFSATTATTFAAAVDGSGTGSYAVTDTAVGITEGVVTIWFDSANLQAVFGVWVNTGAVTTANKLLVAEDTFVEIVRVGMATADYTSANIDAMLSAY